MSNPLDKRKAKRLPIKLDLTISDLFCQDNVKASIEEADIEVFDVSTRGIGFYSTSVLPLNFYFNAKIILGEPDNLVYTVVKIVRIQKLENTFVYGCEFVGLPEILHPAFKKYEESLSE
ncbi:MAG: PilZ domain-containing protein [Lachnospiraceae bacterium]|nr:PilZ domain-containing protein [Lachnospiraceae bacterium]